MEKRTHRSSEKSTTTTMTRSKSQEAISNLKKKIPDVDNAFNIIGRIGTGTFSTVLLGTLKSDEKLPEKKRRKFAIKHHVPTSHPDRLIKELRCMVEIGGKDNVVGIHCTFRHNESVAFVMPYLQHDRFHEYFNKMDTEELQFFMKNLLIAVRRVHKFHIIHRDVKPSNFLYNRRTRQFLLVDFGLAQQITPKPVDSSTTELKRRIGDFEDSIPTDDGEGDAKRIRCALNDLRFLSTRPPTQIMSTPFKMPLKQLNTITPLIQQGKDGMLDSALSRQVKSAILGVTMTNRLQQKLRSTSMRKTIENLGNELSSPKKSANNSPKYQTNRNLGEANASKCYCYGNPQICNICLVRKEVHASRAGTPGYRPPEVLLKYPDQTTAVDIWAVGVILLSILSGVYPFFKAPDDYIALAEMVTIFGDKAIRRTAFALDRLVTLSQRTRPLDLRKLCVRLRNRKRFSSPELIKKYQHADGTCEICKNCEQYFYNCLCAQSHYVTEPLGDDPFPLSAYELLQTLLELNPHKRVTAEEALKHPFFDVLDTAT